ncbi:ATP-binding cassette domain-containing protein [Streptomyces sp. NPDC048566]|uniref:ATP-binding cassette domain-containing protein n=1 Tax=Streptomyces sp. NPDC048566 TaxID=3365569 RepID=UPI0037168935
MTAAGPDASPADDFAPRPAGGRPGTGAGEHPRAAPAGRPGALRRVWPDGRRFLRRHRTVLAALSGWSLLETAQTFLGGYAVARSLDDGFLAGRTGDGLLWLAVAAGASLLGGLFVRQVFDGLAALVEPFRDGLVRRAVDQALGKALTDPARADTTAAVSRLTHQTEIARDSFAGLVLTARSFVFTTAGALLGLASLDPVLLAVVLPPLLGGLVLFLSTFPPMAAAQRAYLDADEALSARTGRLAAGLRDVAACGAAAPVAADLGALIAAQARLSRRLARWAAVRSLALGTAGRLPLVVLLAAAPLLLRGGMTAGALLGALTYVVQALLPALHALMTAAGTAGTRLLVVLERFTERPESAAPRPPDRAAPAGPAAPDPGHRSAPPLAAPSKDRADGAPAAELRGVTFAYGPGARPVLRDLDLTVAPGEHLVVVGPSGIGKSTLTALLAGTLVPDAGSVRVAGAAAADAAADPAARRAVLPQEAYVFTGTVAENLAYLRPDATPAMLARTIRALRLEDLVRGLGGLHGTVDPRRLSPAQRQQLALGRAHVSAASLLLLDEATCHLDPETEAWAERALAARPGTLVLVAHRISSALRADRVLVLDGDRAQCAPHAALLGRSELYRDLVGRWEPSLGLEDATPEASHRTPGAAGDGADPPGGGAGAGPGAAGAACPPPPQEVRPSPRPA